MIRSGDLGGLDAPGDVEGRRRRKPLKQQKVLPMSHQSQGGTEEPAMTSQMESDSKF